MSKHFFLKIRAKGEERKQCKPPWAPCPREDERCEHGPGADIFQHGTQKPELPKVSVTPFHELRGGLAGSSSKKVFPREHLTAAVGIVLSTRDPLSQTHSSAGASSLVDVCFNLLKISSDP